MNSYQGFGYDVIVVGSGAGGGMAAYTLTREGHSVLLLEAGRDYNPYSETPMFNMAHEAPLRGASTPDKNFGFYDATVDGGWQVPGEPYTTGKGSDFLWYRTRMLGGRTNHWGRYALRFSRHDFKGYSRDGLGADWPIEYEELAPWYDKTEKLVGVCGNNPGLDDVPDSGPGVLQPAPKPRVPELLIQAACKKLGIPLAPMRSAVLTRPQDRRNACFYATPCGRGCSIGAAFQTTTSLLPMAQETGRLKIVTDAMVSKLLADSDGRVERVTFVNRKNKQSTTLKARAVVLAASACESARILLNSRNERFPNGLANSSGQVGRNLMDSVGADVRGHVPGLENRPRYNEDGHTGNHLFIPWWGHEAQARGELNFARGYHFEIYSGFGAPGIGMGDSATGFGDVLKERIRRNYGAGVGFALRGEMIPNERSYMDIDPELRDKWGIPVPRFHWAWGRQELNQVTHGLKIGRQIIETMRGTVSQPEKTAEDAILKGGQIIHEVGTTRMGSSRQSSVTDSHGRSWDCRNLFVMDGGVFASNPHKNCTLTIMTLAMRNATRLAAEMRRGAL